MFCKCPCHKGFSIKCNCACFVCGTRGTKKVPVRRWGMDGTFCIECFGHFLSILSSIKNIRKNGVRAT